MSQGQTTQAISARGLLAKNRNFRRLWLGQIISNFGDSLTSLSLLLLVNRLTDGGTAAIATMMIMIALPQISFGLVAGVYVDRLDRKRIMILSDLLRGVLVLAFIPAAFTEQLWALYTIAFAQATIGTFFTPARGALLPNIVAEEALLAANSISQVSRILFNLLGTAAAGVLAGLTATFTPAFAIDAATFFVSMLLISRVQAPPFTPEPGSGNTRAVLVQLRDGLETILRTRVLLGIMIGLGVAMLAIGAVNVLLVPMVVNDLQVPETWFGVIEGAQASSMILSGALVALLAARLKPTRIVSGALAMVGFDVTMIAAVTQVWHLVLILFAVGWVMTPLQAAIATLMQTAVPDRVRGRIGASANAITGTANVVSMAVAGGLAGWIGVRNVFLISGAMVILSGLLAAVIFRGVDTRPELRPAPVGSD